MRKDSEAVVAQIEIAKSRKQCKLCREGSQSVITQRNPIRQKAISVVEPLCHQLCYSPNHRALVVHASLSANGSELLRTRDSNIGEVETGKVKRGTIVRRFLERLGYLWCREDRRQRR